MKVQNEPGVRPPPKPRDWLTNP